MERYYRLARTQTPLDVSVRSAAETLRRRVDRPRNRFDEATAAGQKQTSHCKRIATSYMPRVPHHVAAPPHSAHRRMTARPDWYQVTHVSPSHVVTTIATVTWNLPRRNRSDS